VAIVSAAMAKTFFAGEDAIGRRLRFGDGPWMTVVGISGDVIHNWFTGRNRPTIYRPYDQAASLSLAIAIRAGGDPSALVLPAQAAIRSVDNAQAVYDVMTMHEALRVRTIGLQYVAGIMLVFGVLALILAVVGVYSVMAFMVAQRTHEIGVRIALGATRADVFRLTIGNAARLTATGVVLGLLASTALSRVLEAALDGVLTSDARVSIGVAVVLIASAVLAGYLPARRATGIDPVIALRD
jgi:putative ABC transport system permease protein